MSSGEDAKKPAGKSAKPSWIKMGVEKLDELVVELAKKGETPAKIGLILRDKYGVPRARLLGRRITKILAEKGVPYVTEKEIINKKIEKLRTHIAKNKHDYRASRALTKRLWDIYRLKKQSQ